MSQISEVFIGITALCVFITIILFQVNEIYKKRVKLLEAEDKREAEKKEKQKEMDAKPLRTFKVHMGNEDGVFSVVEVRAQEYSIAFEDEMVKFAKFVTRGFVVDTFLDYVVRIEEVIED